MASTIRDPRAHEADMAASSSRRDSLYFHALEVSNEEKMEWVQYESSLWILRMPFFLLRLDLT
ncbi:uncharacterized protein G2W53_019274 [Senna tora]|uniref:Uncharacterized protein n=1 Tax=Senna tora TaxID=362788 RepID=A0A834WLU8_9FABA|nr:uncharacterized protein G2W53_019274 [Senna tora]